MNKHIPFEGFTPRTFDFLWELQMHNERPWFKEHKEEFHRVVDTPFRALAAEVADRVTQRWPDAGLQVHVSRIYRDARRLFGRGPYKDNLWFSLQRDDHARGPMFWFEINVENYSCGMGQWDRSPQEAELMRKRMAAHPAEFEGLIAALPEGCRLWGEEYKRPKGDLGPVLNPWYNRKALSVGKESPFGKALFTPELVELVSDFFGELLPMWEVFSQVHQLALEQEDQL